jgi:hypothetical protein
MAASGWAASRSQSGRAAPRGTRISRGPVAAISSRSRAQQSGPDHSATENSPVVGSSHAAPSRPSPAATATTKEASPGSTAEASSWVPGVTTRTTSRRTTPFAVRGSSICSHRATRNPCRTRRET